MKKIVIAVAIVIGVMQFIRPEKNISTSPSAANIANHYPMSDDVKAILGKACNDCHSNNTYYPWYASVQPLGWWLDHHVDEGKGELNFDDFLNYKPKKARHKMEEVNEMVKEGEMPLKSYTLVHREAKLSLEEKLKLAEWSVSVMKAIEDEHQLQPVEGKR